MISTHPDFRRAWLCEALWALLTLGGGRIRSCNFGRKRKVGIGHGHRYGCQQRRRTSLELEIMRSHTSLRAPRARYNANRSPASRTTSYDLNPVRFVGPESPETENIGRLDTHTTPTSSTPQSQSHLTHSETERSGVSEFHN